MSTESAEVLETTEPLPVYQSLLLATDSSDHANRGVTEALMVAEQYTARVTGAHVYAAKMHDMRFRQMEGGLPEQFREEQELERQRDVHDDLITRGLSIITDSYLDQLDRACTNAGVPFTRRSLEGKNYRQLVNETNSGEYDLLILGALGLGAVQGSRLGTVCHRVARRSDIDTLIIKQPKRSITAGSIVVAIDGSARAYGGLLTALSFAAHWQVPVKVVSAFDPYYHYVAFNRIASVLSEEAGKVFKFKEQEKLHEEIIDSGLAKIYQGHLDVATSIAAEHGIEIETELLVGKPHHIIHQYIRQHKPSLLVLGKVGIHADPDLDIGGNTEYLLEDVDCAVLLSQRTYKPCLDVLADATTTWTHEAEQRMQNVPDFVQSMARMAILRYAQERGHTVITVNIVEEATAQLMPSHTEKAMEEIVSAYDASELKRNKNTVAEIGIAMQWSDSASTLLDSIETATVRQNLRIRAEKKARTEGATQVMKQHIQHFISETENEKSENSSEVQLHWQVDALARLARVPEGFMRDKSRERIEDFAHRQSITQINLDVAEQGLADARKAMETQMQSDGDAVAPVKTKTSGSKCPFANMAQTIPMGEKTNESFARMLWSPEAEQKLECVPVGFCRDMTRKAAETIAAQKGSTRIEASFVETVMNVFESGSSKVQETLPWDDAARARIQKAPDMIRGMLMQEIEAWAQRNGLQRVNEAAVSAVKVQWQDEGQFHLDPDDPRRG